MTNLTSTARVTRKAVIGLGVFMAVVIVGRIVLNLAITIYQALNPPPPPEPTVGFGVLPEIDFPDTTTDITYRLETPNGGIPSIDRVAVNVYFIMSKRSGFLDLDRAKKQAASLGYVFEPREISPAVYRWTVTDPIPGVLQMDVTRGTFTIDVSWESDPGFLNSHLLPNEDAAVKEVESILKKADSLPADMDDGETKVEFLQYSGGRMSEAASLSEADFLRVDLFRENIEEGVRIMPPDPRQGVARVLISGQRRQGTRYVSMDYRHTQIVYDRFETYPPISGVDAWNKLTSGQGYVAVEPELGTEAVVRRVSWGYYDPLDESQTFLQPIYIFEGDDGFVGYVNAISPDWIKPASEAAN